MKQTEKQLIEIAVAIDELLVEKGVADYKTICTHIENKFGAIGNYIHEVRLPIQILLEQNMAKRTGDIVSHELYKSL